MGYSETSHLRAVCREWAAVRAAWTCGEAVSVTGGDLTIADVVAVALHGIPAQLTDDACVRSRMVASVDFLTSQLAAGKVIYGVNTGFGGSADTRTQDFHRLQSALVQHLNVGILLPADKGQTSPPRRQGTADVDILLRSHALPTAVVRAMMLVRSNSLARGHSAVRVEVVESLLHLLAANMTPVVPLRGSISASGDLSTLSYVAGILEGNPDVYVRCQESGNTGARYLPADQALKAAGVSPVQLQAKEGLGITNGTAPSCAAASIAVHTANQLAVWTQLLTAMGTEALAGTANNYDAFISSARPHRGQGEAAATIKRFLAGSILSPGKAPARVGLAQDRYALRTAPQWIGPQLEDLALATVQVTTELNATTDNPLIDVGDEVSGRPGAVHHGGNFQAMAVTSAMEKTMTALQNLGRLMYTQSAELIDNSRNRGLPPNLSPDDPSTSFLCKGFDVNMAAYQAELAYLARPISGHVQVAEMTNQSVNSMALVAARYALEAGEVVSLMAATYIYVLCQALDLRCMQRLFREIATERLPRLVYQIFAQDDDRSGTELENLAGSVIPQLIDRWDELSHLDLSARGEAAARDTTGAVLSCFTARGTSLQVPDGATLFAFQKAAAKYMIQAYSESRQIFFTEPARASSYLSPASRLVYEFVRLELNIPLNRGIDDHPTLAAEKRATVANGNGETAVNGSAEEASRWLSNGHSSSLANGLPNGAAHHVNDPTSNNNSSSSAAIATPTTSSGANGTRILGTMASEIYMALRNGRLFDRVVAYCEKTKPWEENDEKFGQQLLPN